MLILKGRVYKENDFWLIQLPAVDAMTQGTSRDDAFEMLKDYIETDLEKPIEYEVKDEGGHDFEIEFPKTEEIIAWVSRRTRQSAGKTLS